MSFFNFSTPATSAPLFGTQAAPAASTGGFSLTAPSLFGSTATTTAASLAPNLGQAFPQQAGVSAAISTPGLGGTTNPTGLALGLSGSKAASSIPGQENVMTPKLTPVPQEIVTLVENFKEFLRNQSNLSEKILADDSSQNLENVNEKILQLQSDLTKSGQNLQKLTEESKFLKEESRQNLRYGEMVQHLAESPSYNYEYTILLNYLQKEALVYEQKFKTYAEQIEYFESLLSGKYANSMSLQDILLYLKRMDDILRITIAKYYEIHENIKDLKDLFLHYRRTNLNDKTEYFATSEPSASRDHFGNSPTWSRDHLEGPNPFTVGSTGALLEMAKALTRSQSNQPWGGHVGQAQSSLVGSGLGGGVGGFSAPKPVFGSSTAFIKPPATPFFGGGVSSTTTAAAANLLGTPKPSLFGSPAAFATPLTTNTANRNLATVTPFAAITPYNATLQQQQQQNVGLVRPLGSSTAVGVKRGKTGAKEV